MAGLGVALTQYERGGLFGFFKSGSMVLIIVALLELSKIPLLDVIYKTKSFFYRVFFIIAFCFACVVTFDTLFVSLQMNYNRQIKQPVTLAQPITIDNQKYEQLSLKDAYNIIDNLENKIIDIQFGGDENRKQIENFYAQKATIDKDENNFLTRIDADIQTAREIYNKDRDTVNDEFDRREQSYRNDLETANKQDQAKIDNLDKQITEISAEIDGLKTEKDTTLNNIDSKISDNDTKRNDEIQQKDTEYQEKIAQKTNERNNALPFSPTRKKLTAEIEALPQQLSEKIQEIEQKYKDANKTLNAQKDSEKKSFDAQINEKTAKKDALVKQRENLNNKNSSSAQLQQIRKQRENKLNALDTSKIDNLEQQKQTEIQKFNDKRTEIQQQIDILEQKKSTRLNDEQITYQAEITALKKTTKDIGDEYIIYNLARSMYKWFGDTDKKFLSLSDLDFVVNIWFISLSVVGAVLGSIIYLIYLVQTYPPMIWFKPMLFIKTVVGVPAKIFINACVGILQVFGLNRNFSDKPLPTLRGALRRRTRHVLVALYKRAKTPRPVKIHTVKEIEYQDREVIKHVEKPVVEYVEKEVPKIIEKHVVEEVVKNHYIHVPFYTNDKNIIEQHNKFIANHMNKIDDKDIIDQHNKSIANHIKKIKDDKNV